jgi:hypothetical protein
LPRCKQNKNRVSAHSAPLRRRFGAYSRLGSLALIDGRSKEAKFIQRHRAELAGHCGGSPSAVQTALIERCCWLALRLAQLEAKMAMGELTDHDSNYFIAWSNAYARTVSRLEVDSAASPHAETLTPLDASGVMRATNANDAVKEYLRLIRGSDD